MTCDIDIFTLICIPGTSLTITETLFPPTPHTLLDFCALQNENY